MVRSFASSGRRWELHVGMEGTRPLPNSGTRVRLSGHLDSLTTRKSPAGFTLYGSFRLDAPYHGLSRVDLQLPMGSSLLPGDAAELEGTLMEGGPEPVLFDCCR